SRVGRDITIQRNVDMQNWKLLASGTAATGLALGVLTGFVIDQDVVESINLTTDTERIVNESEPPSPAPVSVSPNSAASPTDADVEAENATDTPESPVTPPSPTAAPATERPAQDAPAQDP